MARIRTIKPSFWTDEKVAGLTRDQRLLAVGLISFADDDGRFVAAVSAISGYVFPHDDLPSTTVRRWRDAVVKAGLIRLYAVDGRDYGWFPNWTKHQVINRPQKSAIPPPPDAPDPPPQRPRKPSQQGADSRSDSVNESVNGSRTSPGVAHGSFRDQFTTGREGEGRVVELIPPLTGGDARVRERGDSTPENSAADALTCLVAEVQAVRPLWTDEAIRSSVRRATAPGRGPDVVRSALLDVASRDDSDGPGRVVADGPWWRSAQPTAVPPPVRARLAGRPELDPQRNTNGTAAARAAIAAAAERREQPGEAS